jgi:hypothetical protein
MLLYYPYYLLCNEYKFSIVYNGCILKNGWYVKIFIGIIHPREQEFTKCPQRHFRSANVVCSCSLAVDER